MEMVQDAKCQKHHIFVRDKLRKFYVMLIGPHSRYVIVESNWPQKFG